MSSTEPTLAEAYPPVDGLFTNAMYREIPGFRFREPGKAHDHEALAALIPPGGNAFELRHWTIQDVTDARHVEETVRLASAYGMTGIQFSDDNLYFVEDSLLRYNAYVHTGELCELCHRHGLEAWFWAHEIRGFFQEWVRDGRYGFYDQLVGGEIDLSSGSGYWQRLAEKYDVFLRRLPGVDGLVLTLNECQVPAFRDGCVRSDLTAAQRVARIGRIVREACERHGKRLLLRTFCYTPEESEKVAQGVEAIGGSPWLMIKCVPHDWQTFYPHDPLIAAFCRRYRVVVEFDLAHEPMGAGRFPYPDAEHLAHRFRHAASCGARGVAGRIDRFRNHAAGTLNWSNVSAFARLAVRPDSEPGALLAGYATADFGPGAARSVTDWCRRFYAAGQVVFFLGREWASGHSNVLDLGCWRMNSGWSRVRWDPTDAEAAHTLRRLSAPDPDFIAACDAERASAVADLERMASEIADPAVPLAAPDRQVLADAVRRACALAKVLTTQHAVLLRLRHDLPLPAAARRYGAELTGLTERLRHLATIHHRELLETGNEGCQYAPEMVELFCRRAHRLQAELHG